MKILEKTRENKLFCNAICLLHYENNIQMQFYNLQKTEDIYNSLQI